MVTRRPIRHFSPVNSGHFLVSGYDQKVDQKAIKFQFCVVCNQKARVSEVRLVLLKGFETCCTHTLCIKGLVLTTKVKISSGPVVFDLRLRGLCWMKRVDKNA